jgi:hypothetical protein
MNERQCRVASDGIGDDTDVVRSELAPFSNSILMFRSHNGKNLAKHLTGSAFAKASINKWTPRTAFARTLVLA